MSSDRFGCRRKMNRESARRTRFRKQQQMTSLELQVMSFRQGCLAVHHCFMDKKLQWQATLKLMYTANQQFLPA